MINQQADNIDEEDDGDDDKLMMAMTMMIDDNSQCTLFHSGLSSSFIQSVFWLTPMENTKTELNCFKYIKKT